MLCETCLQHTRKKLAFPLQDDLYLSPQASDKRSATITGRRKQEPQGDSTPGQARKNKDPQGSH
jgi:hypothetical protein